MQTSPFIADIADCFSSLTYPYQSNFVHLTVRNPVAAFFYGHDAPDGKRERGLIQRIRDSIAVVAPSDGQKDDLIHRIIYCKDSLLELAGDAERPQVGLFKSGGTILFDDALAEIKELLAKCNDEPKTLQPPSREDDRKAKKIRLLIAQVHTFPPGSSERKQIRAWAEKQTEGRTREGAVRLLSKLGMRQVDISTTLRMKPPNVHKCLKRIRK